MFYSWITRMSSLSSKDLGVVTASSITFQKGLKSTCAIKIMVRISYFSFPNKLTDMTIRRCCVIPLCWTIVTFFEDGCRGADDSTTVFNHRFALSYISIGEPRAFLLGRSRPRRGVNEIFTMASVSYPPEDILRVHQAEATAVRKRQGHSVTTGRQGQSTGKKSRVMTARSDTSRRMKQPLAVSFPMVRP